MSSGKMFRSTDLVALDHFLGARALMTEILDGTVKERMKLIFQTIDSNMDFWRDDRCFAVANANWKSYAAMIGFWLPHEDPAPPVWIGVTLFVNPKTEDRSTVIAAFRDWRKKHQDWQEAAMDDPREWGWICKGRAIQTFLAADDHVRAVEAYLLQLLEEVAEFRNTSGKGIVA